MAPPARNSGAGPLSPSLADSQGAESHGANLRGADPRGADPRGAASPPDEWAGYPSRRYAWYVVAVLTLAYVFSFLDRQIIVFMIDHIRRDFGLSNVQVGLLHGSTFALFYTLFGLPVGRWADSHSRRALIAGGFVLWSLMTGASGLAQRFWHLLACRTGVAIGEATLSPAAYSLISDYFPPRRRSTAIGVYSFGIYFGSGLSLVCLGLLMGFLGGAESLSLPLVGAVRPWQAVFFIVGLPGVLVAGLFVTVREPPRRRALASGGPASASAALPLREVLAFLAAHRGAFSSLFFGGACLTFAGYANTTWVVKFFTQRHGWNPAQTGVTVGLIIAVAGALGAVGGGRLADALRVRGHSDANLRVAFLGAVLMATASFFYPLASSGAGSAAWLFAVIVGVSAPFGVVAAAVQQISPAPMRAQASALFLFVINVLGMGLGPPITGWLIDHLFPGDENRALCYALVIGIATGSILAGLIFALGLRPYRRTAKELEL